MTNEERIDLVAKDLMASISVVDDLDDTKFLDLKSAFDKLAMKLNHAYFLIEQIRHGVSS